MTSSPNGWQRRPTSSVARRTSDRLRNSMTPQEVKVWNWLREQLHPVGWKFRRQVRIGGYVADFASLRPKVVIEIDGDDHGTEDGQEKDRARDAFLQSEGFTVIRFWNSEIGQSGDVFATALLGKLDEAGIRPLPVEASPRRPSPEGRDQAAAHRSSNLIKRGP